MHPFGIHCRGLQRVVKQNGIHGLHHGRGSFLTSLLLSSQEFLPCCFLRDLSTASCTIEHVYEDSYVDVLCWPDLRTRPTKQVAYCRFLESRSGCGVLPN